MKKIFIFILGFIIISTPFAASAATPWKGVVPNCNTGDLVNIRPLYDTSGKQLVIGNEPQYEKGYKNPCDFNFLMVLINNLINFLLFIIVTPLVALALVYAGFLMIFSGGSSEKVTKVKTIVKNVVIGYVIALAAWLIVNTILKTLGFNDSMFVFLKSY